MSIEERFFWAGTRFLVSGFSWKDPIRGMSIPVFGQYAGYALDKETGEFIKTETGEVVPKEEAVEVVPANG